ncbi:MAG: hypothetical protein ACREDR_44690 [Blastocatellia bacterium]
MDRTSENLDKLAAIVQQQAATAEINYRQLAESAEINRQDLRQAIENLIIGNEATRELANKAGQLAINVSQRLVLHEKEPHQ